MVIENKHEIGDVVYLVTDEDQKARIVCAIEVFKSGELLYRLACGTITASHYDFEISNEKDVVKTSTN